MDYKPLILNALETLEKKDTAEKRVFQARAYKKVIKQLKTTEGPIHTIDDLNHIEGAGDKIKAKFAEILSTGKLAAAERVKAEFPFELYDALQKIYGVGPVKAKDLIEKDKITSIADLRTRNTSLLNDKQTIGLQYYDDINERIPREEMIAHANLLMASLPPSLEGTIVGSFRRKAATSGDIDMLLKGSKGFKDYIKTLKDKNYILETLAEGDKKCLAIAKLNPSSKGRRLDLLVSPKEEYAYAILYFTGSDLFNVAMRRYALTLGYTMNEHTMVSIGEEYKAPHPMENERDIFDFLGLQYVEPENRIDSTSIVAKTKSIKIKK